LEQPTRITAARFDHAMLGAAALGTHGKRLMNDF
jgi:hypothetical protein